MPLFLSCSFISSAYSLSSEVIGAIIAWTGASHAGSLPA